MAAEPPLYTEVADPGSLRPFGEQIEAWNPAGWPGYPDQLRRARQATGARHAVTTGLATVGGQACVLAGFEFGFLGGSMGTAEGARIAEAFAVAAARRLPLVSVAASGGTRMQEGTVALAQMQTAAAAVVRARQAGIPHLAVAGDPTTGGVWSSLIAGADLVFSVPGARVSFSGSRTRPAGADPAAVEYFADGQYAHGGVDVLVPRPDLRATMAAAVQLLSPESRDGDPQPAPVPARPEGPDGADASGHLPPADAWAHVSAARRVGPARAERWLAGYFGPTVEIRGDRCGGVDAGVRCGFGSHDGTTVAYIAQLGERITPAGFRTAARLLGLASRFRLPVLTLIDTPGAAAAPADEAASLGAAIAELFAAVAACEVPVTSVVIGEGVSGGALALASPASLWIARDAYLAVTAPELAAAILKLGEAQVPEVAARLRLTPADLLSQGLVRGII
ncbi:MAG TPA: carboxyl transferase domain-containing protein [Streptosporangiaceae bacterium]